MSSTAPRRYGPAVAMIAGILAAAVLAILAPFHMSGSWQERPDEWQLARERIIDGSQGVSPAGIDPYFVTLLEPVRHGFAFAALDRDGLVFAGIADARGAVIGFTSEPGSELAMGAWMDGYDEYFALVVRRDPSGEGFRHELRSFATEQEQDAFLASREEGLSAGASLGGSGGSGGSGSGSGAAAGPGTGASMRPESIPSAASLPTAEFEQAEWGGDGALIEGELLIEGSCVYVVGADQQPRLLLLPSVGEPAVEGDALRFAGHRFTSGDRVEFGGGESSIIAGDSVPVACAGAWPAFRVFHPPVG